jgi:hypothetical protein
LEVAAQDVRQLEWAVRQQEDMAFGLRQLTPADRTEFIRLLPQVADEWRYDTKRAYRAAVGRWRSSTTRTATSTA